jgi:hypothetical protein
MFEFLSTIACIQRHGLPQPGAECQERAAVNWLTFFQTNLRRHQQ